MIPADATFDGTWPFEPRFSDAPSLRMHDVDAGANRPVLCIYGEPNRG